MHRRLALDEGWITVLLVGAMVYAALHAVAVSGWGDRVTLATRLGLAGVSIGLLAAKTRFRTVWALLVALVAGVEAVFVTHALASPGGTWSEKLDWLAAAVWGWYWGTRSTGATYDPLVLGLLASLVAYTLGLYTSWLIFRLRAGWLALIMVGGVGLIHLSYATVDSIQPFLLSIFLGVLTVASLEIHLRRSAWRAVGFPVQGASTGWSLISAACLGAGALLAASVLPSGDINDELSSRYQAVTEPWKELQEGVDRFVGGSRGVPRASGGLLFGRSLVPREEFEPGTHPVLKVKALQRRYWRGATFDHYDGNSISTSETSEQRYEAEQPLPTDPEGGSLRTTLAQHVTILAPGATGLFAADAPTSFALPVLAYDRGMGWDLAAVRALTPLQRGQSYTVISAIPIVGQRELREVSSSYPEWLEPYLKLPPTLPGRVSELAERTSADARTPYDRALQIEAYLRSLSYSTRATVPPPERDWVDFFLFDSKTGYCDYFATAMTVLLRTQGVPARVASGFAPGELDDQDKAFLSRESDAHSWTEAYFPGYGWQVFEPSAIRTVPVRPESGRAASTQQGRGTSGPVEDFDELGGAGAGASGLTTRASPLATPLASALAGLAVALVVGGVVVAVASALWERGLRGEPRARRRYDQLRRLLSWGGWSIPASTTPFELAEQLSRSFPEQSLSVQELTGRYTEATYGSLPGPNSSEASEAAWRALRWPIAAAMIRRRFLARRGR